MICEDMWFADVAECLDESGAEMFIVLNGSPYETYKYDDRLGYAVARITEAGLPLVYVHLVGGQDELVFDGASFVLGADCTLLAKAPSFVEELLITQWRRAGEAWICEPAPISAAPEPDEANYRALVLGLRD